MDRELLFYQPKGEGVQCQLCPHQCFLQQDSWGKCRARTVKNGVAVAENYGEVTAVAMDPIEKKPLYHYKPGSNILSIGSFGCNMSCTFCQNYSISQERANSRYIPIEELLTTVKSLEHNVGVAFTYNEPFMWYEYVLTAAKALKEYNPEISVVLVTNGYVNPEPLERLLPYVDAMNIDLKGYNDRFYQGICGATLEPVRETIQRSSKHCHVEVTTLLVTEENDSIEEVSQIAQFIAGIDKNIPFHLSRYFPNYQMANEATDLEQMIDAWEEAKKYLSYVYLGNVQGADNDTYCSNCGEQLIRRSGYQAKILVEHQNCRSCGQEINIIR